MNRHPEPDLEPVQGSDPVPGPGPGPASGQHSSRSAADTATRSVDAAFAAPLGAGVEAALDARGTARLPGLLPLSACRRLAALHQADQGFRSRVVMARHGFGRGEYRYFAYPLPPLLESLRQALYRKLVPIANRWQQQLGLAGRFPPGLDAFLRRCHDAGQLRPTPLLLQYGQGDYNCLHQDLYGDHVFPLQVAILLSAPGRDFSGGEFVVTEQASAGSRAEVVQLDQGDAVVFAVNRRPLPGRRGYRSVGLRHGVSRIHHGQRHTVGLIFHDAA